LAPNWHQTAPNFAAFRGGWHQNSRVFGLPCGGIIFSAGAGCSFFSPLCAASRCPAAPIGPVLKSAPRASCARQGMPAGWRASRGFRSACQSSRRCRGGGARSVAMVATGRQSVPRSPLPVHSVKMSAGAFDLALRRRGGRLAHASRCRWRRCSPASVALVEAVGALATVRRHACLWLASRMSRCRWQSHIGLRCACGLAACDILRCSAVVDRVGLRPLASRGGWLACGSDGFEDVEARLACGLPAPAGRPRLNLDSRILISRNQNAPPARWQDGARCGFVCYWSP
jgi:hypothetical protein